MILNVGKGGKSLSSEETNYLYHESLIIGLENLVCLQNNLTMMDLRAGGFKKKKKKVIW
jgi:hypothetical protein